MKFIWFQHISSSKHRKRINATNAALNCRSEAYHYSSATPGAQQCFHGSSNTQERPCPHFTKVNTTTLGPAIHRCCLVQCTLFTKENNITMGPAIYRWSPVQCTLFTKVNNTSMGPAIHRWGLVQRTPLSLVNNTALGPAISM